MPQMLDSATSKLFLLFVFSTLVFTAACPPRIAGGYEVKDGEVIFNQGMKGLGAAHHFPVVDADPATFEIINKDYGKDIKRAFYKGKVISKSDGPSFAFLESAYSSDKYHVYYYGAAISDKPSGFKIIYRSKNNGPRLTLSTDGERILKGKNSFMSGKADAGSFEQIDRTDYFRDKFRVYSLNKIIDGADPATFEIVGRFDGRYTQDANAIFYNGNRVPGIDKATHDIIDEVHHRDASKVFFGLDPLSEDPENFKVLSRAYSKDSKSVYWRGRKISDDAAKFIAFPSERSESYAKDSTASFWGWKVIEDADVESFTGLNHKYAKDKNHVYFGSLNLNSAVIVKDADPDSFELVKGEKGIDARDKNGPYYFGVPRRKKNDSSL
jgi:hypothetical protein